MRTICAVALACVALAAGPAFGADDASPCAKEPSNAGMNTRMKTMQEQMDRIEWTTDRAEQRRLMDLHMKHMSEGLRELRKREMGMGCRMEMMSSMMEAMIRHERVMHDNDSR